ncbi:MULTISPECIES: hypothetical protein [Novosphingobium]|uniref:Uncharacterized protein n=2 Tax=Novosphingobium TaxID=165696 RepID=A0ABT0AA68_9SPHN|nr:MULTISPECIES: hypothetical protein [Novosphingobium]MCJ1960098.1 hypothetical protein [Novosphingobium mangrovi (ex Hu et al. 2023)]MED5545516.1 hypothetical protein [Pseudomonadota bacterium]QVM82839.1 hypothetical protein HT578_03175 [Novosphingobium decolorationis]
MARTIEAYVDDRGHLHTSPSTAVVADIAAILGRVGDEGGLTSGVAALILEKREAIEKAFADFDKLTANGGEVIDASDRLRWKASGDKSL